MLSGLVILVLSFGSVVALRLQGGRALGVAAQQHRHTFFYTTPSQRDPFTDVLGCRDNVSTEHILSAHSPRPTKASRTHRATDASSPSYHVVDSPVMPCIRVSYAQAFLGTGKVRRERARPKRCLVFLLLVRAGYYGGDPDPSEYIQVGVVLTHLMTRSRLLFFPALHLPTYPHLCCVKTDLYRSSSRGNEPVRSAQLNSTSSRIVTHIGVYCCHPPLALSSRCDIK